MEDGSIVRVIKDFLTINEGELCVTKGEYLQVLHTVDRYWVFCRLEHREGIVPTSHVTHQEIQYLEETQSIFMAQCNLPGERDFPIPKGSLIISHAPVVDDWFRGETLDGVVGTFNVRNCWEMDASNYRKHNTRTKVEKFAQVLHPMTAQLAEEMDLEKGQIVKITQIVDKDWYRGESNGRSGIFPASFVRIVDSFPGDMPPVTADLTMYLNAASQKSTRGNNDYMNTRNTFVGLEENLRALVPKLESSNVVFGSQGVQKKLTRGSSLIEEDDYFRRNLPPSYCPGFESNSSEFEQCSQGFQELSRNLSYLQEQKNFQTREDESLQQKIDYTNLSKNLSVFEAVGKEETLFNALLGRQAQKSSDNNVLNNDDLNNNEKEDLRYQNITCENLGYTGSSVDVRPYGIARFNFVAQFENELSLNEGDMVYLRRYVDQEWLDGEMDGRRGLFPISYVNIIVDLESNEPFKSTAVTVHENLKTDTYHKVLYTFQAQMDGDLSLAEGEVVRIKEQHNADWVVVENSFGELGLCPGNHLDPNPDYQGKAVFDIERLLTYKAQIEKQDPEPATKTAPKAELKFFDPLCSPDDEMLQVEAELERRSRENLEQKINCARQQHQQRALTTASKEPSKKDLESLISSNLSKIAALQSKVPLNATPAATAATATTLKATQKNGTPTPKLDFSESVLAELRGRQKPPPRPPEPQKSPQQQVQVSQTYTPPVTQRSNKPSGPKPLLHFLKRPAPSRPPPPPPPPASAPSSIESLYASINKVPKKDSPGTSQNQATGLNDKNVPAKPNLTKSCSLGSKPVNKFDLPPLPVRPPRPPSPKKPSGPPTPPSEPPPQLEFCTAAKDMIVTSADIHAEDGEHGYNLKNSAERTPTNEIYGSLPLDTPIKNNTMESNSMDSTNQMIYAECSSPSVPARTSSRQTTVIAKSYLNLKDVHHHHHHPHPSFPPDRESPGEHNSMPPKVPPALSVRSSSVKSRSAHYTSVASECEDSLILSSLNHSYETLNMYDANEISSAPNRVPHRPAPPVPSSKKISRRYSETPEGESDKFDNISNKRKSKHPMSRRTLRQRKIHSLKRQIQIKEKMLETFYLSQEQLLRELDMYQEIAVAKGNEYDVLNQKMDHCQENIETLSDEIQRLQACLGDEEMKLEEDSIEESRRKADEEHRRTLIEVQRREEEKRLKEEKRRKDRERRENVISELVVTEREFCRDLKLTWQAFGLDTPAMLEQRGVDVPTLFGNVSEVIDISEKFLDTLQEEVKSKSNPEEQMVGKCFLQHSETMKTVYTEYCINHDKAEQLLEKYDQIQDIQRMLQKGVETLQSQVSCFNMGSILIKPVQRILKYPLILNELIKCTEDSHMDRNDLVDAVMIMSDVASFINESKRRKDIIDKYKTEEDKTLTRKISKLNLHSIGKKSARMSTRFFSTIGLDPMNRDLDFEELEKRFSAVIRTVQSFSFDCQRFRDQLHESVICQYNIAETVAELYKDRVHMREVDRFRTAHRNIISTYWNEFNTKMEPRVIRPLQMLNETFQGPNRLIQKRHDKQLDLQASTQRAEKNRDPTKTRSLSDEVDKCRSTFDALNVQLLEELPKLLEVSSSIFTEAVTEFVLLRKLFVGRVTKELLSLMDLPLLASTSGDILEVFLVKHSMVCTQLGRFSFSSKAFRPEDKKKRSPSPIGQQLGQRTHEIVPQTPNIRTVLRGKYAAAKLYQANQLYVPTDLLDIGISPGDLVGVVQKKDPMGSSKRWFVDNGTTQGFLPCHVLTAFGETFEAQSKQEEVKPVEVQAEVPVPNPAVSSEATPPPAAHSYDDVAAEEDEAQTSPQQQPVRKAPPVPKATAETAKPETAKSEVVERASHHSYEEIAASEANSEPSQDLSPIYEEIHGGSRSSVSGSSCSSGGSRSVISTGSGSSQLTGTDVGIPISASGIQRGNFYYALYDFDATESSMLPLYRGQVVRVVHLTGGDWCYVEDRHMKKGYVPSPYLKLYTHNQNNNLEKLAKDEMPKTAEDE